MNLQTRLISPYAFAGLMDNQRKNYDMDGIIQIVSKHTGKTFEQMLDRSRNEYLVESRGLCYLFIKQILPQSRLKEIGNYFGGYDHTSILHNIEAVKNKMLLDNRLCRIYNKIEMELNSCKILDELKSLKIN
mgnify:CR=1 FL=1